MNYHENALVVAMVTARWQSHGVECVMMMPRWPESQVLHARVPRGFGELRQIWFGLNGAERNVFTHSRSIKRGIETHHGGAQWRLIR